MIRELTAAGVAGRRNIGAIVVREGASYWHDLDSLKAEEETPGEVMEASISAELLDSHKPIVAALCGPAYGAAALALSCDFLIAARTRRSTRKCGYRWLRG